MCALLTSLASRVDGFGPPHCLPAVLAANPHTPAADTAIDNSKVFCENKSVARDPCNRIVRPSAP
jgi:hypothetical protein